MLITGSFVLLLAGQIISSALACRFHEFLDGLPAGVVAWELPQRRGSPLPVALSCCTPGITLRGMPEPFTRCEIAPGSSHVQ